MEGKKVYQIYGLGDGALRITSYCNYISLLYYLMCLIVIPSCHHIKHMQRRGRRMMKQNGGGGWGSVKSGG